VTKWQHSHPGGAHSIRMAAGSDATEVSLGGHTRKLAERSVAVGEIVEEVDIDGWKDGKKDRDNKRERGKGVSGYDAKHTSR
jgi:cytochrome b involved in lipid metabolism